MQLSKWLSGKIPVFVKKVYISGYIAMYDAVVFTNMDNVYIVNLKEPSFYTFSSK